MWAKMIFEGGPPALGRRCGCHQPRAGEIELSSQSMQQPDELHGDLLIPSAGDQVEVSRTGISRRGTVQYADWLQVLVKWQDGSSGSLRVGRDDFRILAQRDESSAA
jgi:hypothetical protein